jgi:hypothetical protein
MPCEIGTFGGFGPNMGTTPRKEKGEVPPHVAARQPLAALRRARRSGSGQLPGKLGRKKA